MKRINIIILLGVLISSFILPFAKSSNDIYQVHNEKIDSSLIRHFKLSNGMRLHFLKVDEASKIELFGTIRAGSVFDPPDKIGLANVVGKMLRNGGTKNRTGDVIDDELDSLGTELDIEISLINGQIKMTSTKGAFKRSLKILSELFTNPAFEVDRLNLTKINYLDYVRKQKEKPDSFAFIEFQKLLYGKNSPYARTPTKETIYSLNQQDVFDFYNNFIKPNNINFAIWGNFSFDEKLSEFEEFFGAWAKSTDDNPPFPKVEIKKNASINLIRKVNSNQSKLRIGHLGITLDRNNPYNKDYVALLILDLLFGGKAYSSRLYKKIRSELGLSYDIFSMYWPSFYYPSTFLIAATTRSDTTIKATESILKELKKICEGDISQEEVNQVKEFLLNTYAFELGSPKIIVARILFYEYRDIPLDYFLYIYNEIPNIEVQDVKRAAKKFLHPESLCILIVGDEKKFDSPLSALGKVNVINNN